MASLPPPKRRRANGSDGVLPRDVLYDILLLLPAKPLCRFRAVCRSWRSLLSDPLFVAAHESRHPGPHLAVGVCDRFDAGGIEVVDFYIVDMFGDVVKRVCAGRCSPHDICTQRDLVLLVGNDWRLRVLDPATGKVSLAPDDEHHPRCSFTLGQAASTGEYKVLRITDGLLGEQQTCKVLTLGGTGNTVGRRLWRKTRSPPYVVDTWRDVAVAKGVAYFLLSCGHNPPYVQPDWIAAFDLETEQWRPDHIDGPLTANEIRTDGIAICLTVLRGCLVVVCDDRDGAMDLWFLNDEVLWSKQYAITMHGAVQWSPAEPLLVLDDGRIVLWVWVSGSRSCRKLMRLYDPRTGTYTDVAEAAKCTHVGVYTGGLLRLGTPWGS